MKYWKSFQVPAMEVDVLKRKLQPLFKEDNIEKAILFGSFARNEASRHSDLDLILIQKTNLRFLDRYDDLLASFRLECRSTDIYSRRIGWNIRAALYTASIGRRKSSL